MAILLLRSVVLEPSFLPALPLAFALLKMVFRQGEGREYSQLCQPLLLAPMCLADKFLPFILLVLVLAKTRVPPWVAYPVSQPLHPTTLGFPSTSSRSVVDNMITFLDLSFCKGT